MPPVSEAQRRWAWANRGKDTKEGHAAAEYAAADAGGKLPSRVMNPVMHTHHPMEKTVKHEMMGEEKKTPRREMFDSKRNPMHKTFGRTSTKGGLSYLKGGNRGGPPVNEGSGPMEDDSKSEKMEGNEIGEEGLKNNNGSKRKSGYGNPQGGTTTTPVMGGPKEMLEDETRGTHELQAHPYSVKHEIPQEHKERIARALMRRKG
jgi:hypothetical protein